MARTERGPCREQHFGQEDLVVPQKLGGVFRLPVTVGRALGAERPEAELSCSWTLWVGSSDRMRGGCFWAPACLSREGWSGSGLGPSGDLSAHTSGTRAGLMPRLVSVGTAGQSARAASLCGLGCSLRKRVRRKYLESRRPQGVGGSRVALSDPDSRGGDTDPGSQWQRIWAALERLPCCPSQTLRTCLGEKQSLRAGCVAQGSRRVPAVLTDGAREDLTCVSAFRSVFPRHSSYELLTLPGPSRTSRSGQAARASIAASRESPGFGIGGA